MLNKKGVSPVCSKPLKLDCWMPGWINSNSFSVRPMEGVEFGANNMSKSCLVTRVLLVYSN